MGIDDCSRMVHCQVIHDEEGGLRACAFLCAAMACYIRLDVTACDVLTPQRGLLTRQGLRGALRDGGSAYAYGASPQSTNGERR